MAESKKSKCYNGMKCNGSAGGAYFLAMIGAAVFYIQESSTFWQGVVAIIKAIVWPAFLTYHLFGL